MQNAATRKIASLALAGSVLCLATSAQAQEFGRRGRFIIAAERLFGLSFRKSEIDPDNTPGSTHSKETSFGLFGQRQFNDPANLYTMPRAAFDYFIIDGLSIGGTVMLWTTHQDTEGNVTNQFAFELAPRVGYAFMFTDTIGIWPRGGLSIAHTNLHNEPNGPNAATTDTTLNSFAFDVEAPFVFTPVDHVAILAGPAIDVAMVAGGEYQTAIGNQGYDASIFHFGLYAGLGTWF